MTEQDWIEKERALFKAEVGCSGMPDWAFNGYAFKVWLAAKRAASDGESAALGFIADIRAALGDPDGRLMQDELLDLCREMAKRQAVPEGWAVVPVEPTDDMTCVDCEVPGNSGWHGNVEITELRLRRLWADMLAAAPAQGGGS